jgi:hypothetical protein
VVGEGLTTPHRKITASYEMLHRASELEGSCEHGDEPSGPIKGRKFLDEVSDYQLLKKDSSPWS